jgi:hypothetical protein
VDEHADAPAEQRPQAPEACGRGGAAGPLRPALVYSRPLDAEVTNQGIGIHHARFGKALQEKMDELGIPCEVVAGGSRLGGGTPTKVTDFLKEHLGVKK